MGQTLTLKQANAELGTNYQSWWELSVHEYLTEDFIRRYQDKLDWECISHYQKLSEDFIREFVRKVDWWWISVSQKLSENFVREFQKKLNIPTQYVVSLTTTERGGRGVPHIVGTFDNKEKAVNALDAAFHKTCDEYGVKELNEYSYYTEGESFNIEDENSEFSVYGELTETFLNVISLNN